ncbi:MAG: heme ABC exporter ATP-binding protein CcmA [Actinomycetota bacterium]
MALQASTSARATMPVLPETGAEGPAVALANVTRLFGSSPAIVRVDLSVERGEMVVLRGPNGAGKTTLLRLIATAISPTYGGGAVLGHDLVRGRKAIRRRVELMGHRTRLYEDLSAAENLSFACGLFGLDRRQVDPALERVGLADVSRERVRGFSQGMRQRVALARVLIRRPGLLLLDEPYAGLDERAKDLVDEVVDRATGAGGTVILATHDTSRGSTASRTLRMDGGRLR